MSIRILMIAAALTLALIGCQSDSDRDPTSIDLGDAAMMRLNLVVPTNLNIDAGEITITKGDLEYSQSVDLQDGSATVVFNDVQPGIWQIHVALYDADGFMLYEGSAEAEVHGGETTSAHIVLTELTGDLEVVIELPSDENVLFEDHFTNGMSEEWVSVKPVQWVEDGWLLTQADGSYGRDSYAFVHDGDTFWTDYELRLVADGLPSTNHDNERGDIFFRTSEIVPSYFDPRGNFYRLHMVCVDPNGPVGIISLARRRVGVEEPVNLFVGPAPVTTDPVVVVVRLTGPRIQISIDGTQVVDLIDPDPLLYGGVGVGAIWECLHRFDDVVVTSVPTPTVPSGFVNVPAGTFLMGSPEDEPGRLPGEDQHQVTLTHGFYIQTTEVTNQQYRDLAQWAYDHGYYAATSTSLRDNLDGSTQELLDMDASGCEISFSSEAFTVDAEKENHPVSAVTWYGAASYCDWLSLQQGLPRAYNHSMWQCNGGDPYTAVGYRLSTEAEWEYACRAGSVTAFENGPITYLHCNPIDPNLDLMGWYCGNAGGWTHPVAQKLPNAWGLYDMHGNVWEWCNDWYGAYSSGPVMNPTGPEAGTLRVARCGNWNDLAQTCRSAFRNGDNPGNAYGVAFRKSCRLPEARNSVA